MKQQEPNGISRCGFLPHSFPAMKRGAALAAMAATAALMAQAAKPSVTVLAPGSATALTPGPNGVVYGGAGNDVFELVPPSSPAGGDWTSNILHSFNPATEGTLPISLTLGPGGVIYGTNIEGGPNNAGVLFSLTPPASPGDAWTETSLLAYGTNNTSGTPNTMLVPGTGAFYASIGVSNTVVSLAPPAGAGDPWIETPIFKMPFSMGNTPTALAVGPGGTIYVVNQFGGAFGDGTVVAIAPPASPKDSWTGAKIYDFGTNPNDARYPVALAVDAAANLYVATNNATGFNGAIAMLSPPASEGGDWSESVIHNFGTNPDDGEFPTSIVVMEDGKLAGTTQDGGLGSGTVFWMIPPAAPGGAWTEHPYRFPRNGSNGKNPLFVVSAGRVLYGSCGDNNVNSGNIFLAVE